MIAHVASLVRWEWFKLRRRWMPWILLVVLLLFSQLFVWGNFFSYRNAVSSGGQITFGAGVPGGRDFAARVNCNDLLAGRVPDLPPGIDPTILEGLRQSCQRMTEERQERLRETYATFTLPGSIPNALGVAQGIGLILIAILTASALGSEYGWGTLRAVLARGTGRWQFLTAKLALMALLAGGALIVVVAATVVSSLAARGLAASEVDVGTSPGWTDAAIALGKAWLALLPYVALAGLISVLTRSSAVGMAVALGYNFAEQIAVAILINVFDWFQTVADYTLGRNITAWMLGTQREGISGMTFGAGIRIGEYPGELHAFLVMVTYILALGGLAFWLFQRRDITVSGAAG